MTHAGLQGLTRRCLITIAIAFGLAAGLLLTLAAVPAVPHAQAQGEAGNVMIYTGTTGFRHSGAIDAGQPLIQAALEDAGYTVDWEDCNGPGTTGNGCQAPDNNPSIFTSANLEQYDAILLFNASDWWTGGQGDPGQLFDGPQREAIIEFVQNGGGIAANHNAVDMAQGDVVSWDWWDGDENSVVGTRMGSHAATDINNEATVQVADRNHLSTRDLPDTYEFGDEHYNFFDNVRGTHHVLATLDERTYNVSGNPTGRQDHPISWCKTYDGDNVEDGTGDPKPYSDGRSWVSGMGHFGASYTENGGDNELVNHIVGGVRWVAGEGLKSDCTGTDWSSFERTTLVDTASDGPIAIDVAQDGKVYWTEIGYPPGFNSEGYVMMHDQNGPANNKTIVATIPTRADHGNSEDGVLGMSLQPGFDLSDPDSRDIYVYYSPRGENVGEDWPTSGSEQVVGFNLISRFTLNAAGTAFEDDSEQEILRVDKAKISGNPSGFEGGPSDNGPGHVGGASLVFDAEGNLVLGVGDDVSPNASGHDRLTPLDYRAAERWDARKTSANTGDLRGKVLRVDPIEGAAGEQPGEGQTYEIPETNMFAGDSDPNTRGEIFAMGFRQPFTVHADPENPDTVAVGEFCHDNSSNVDQRAPAGVCEWNLVDEPAFHGWPFCVGDNAEINTSWRWDYDNQSPTGEQHDCSQAEIPSDLDWEPDGAANPNPGPTNPGAETIPGPAAEATIWNKYPGAAGGEDPLDFGNLNPGGKQPITGPIYRHSETAGQGAFPAYYDGSWIIANRGSDGGFWKEVRLRSDDNEMLRVHDFMPDNQFGEPRHSQVIGTRFGPDGALYLARFPVGCCRNTGTSDVEIFKIESSVVDECLEDEFAPNVSGNVTGQPHPTDPDTWVSNYQTPTLNISANDVGCAGVDYIEYSLDGGGTWERVDDTSAEVPFPDPGEYEVMFRAADQFEPANVSDPQTTTFSVVEVDDTTSPEVSAEVTGQQNDDGDYVNGADLEVTATDEISPIETIEYSTDGGETWNTETYEDGQYDDGYSELLEAEFTEAGDYTVLYRATEAAGNTSEEGTVEFTIVEPDVCVGPRSDEFDGDALDPKWEMVSWDENRDDASVSDGNLVFPLGANSFDQARAGPMTMLGQSLPDGDFTMEAQISAPGLNTDTGMVDSDYAQVGFKLFQTEDDWIKVSHTRQAAGGGTSDTYFELVYEDEGNRTLGDQTGQASAEVNLPTFWLRVNRSGDEISADYAIEDPAMGGSWEPLTNSGGTTVDLGIFDPADGPVHIGPYGGNGTIDTTYEYIRFTPDEEPCPEPCRSDEFDGSDLDPAKWNIRVDEPGEHSIEDGQLVLPILNEVDGTETGPLALVSQDVPEGDWSLTTRVTPDLNSSWAQAGIMLWQSDGNFVKYVFGRTADGGDRRIEMASDDPIDQRNTGDNANVPNDTETVWLRLNREGNTIFGEWAFDEDGEPGEWNAPGIQTRPVDTDPPREGEGVQLGLYAGSDIDGAPYEQMARFDLARFVPDDDLGDCPGDGDTTPPVTTHELDPAEPPDGGYDQVDVTLSATDPGEGGGGETETHEVDAVGILWEPDAVAAESGDTVQWNFPEEQTNFPHDVWLLGPEDPPGSEGTELTDGTVPPGGPPVSSTFDEEGTYRYVCKVHSFVDSETGEWSGMVGTLEVGPDSGGGGGEASGVDFTEYRVNTDGETGEWQPSDNANDDDPFETTFTIDQPGEHVVEYRSTDNAGNEEEIKSFEVAVQPGDGDTTPPETDHLLVPPAPGDGGTYNRMVRIVFFADDPGANASGVDFTEYRENGGDWQVYDPFMPPRFTEDGDYTIDYRSTDNEGNVEEMNSVEFSIQAIGEPEVELTALPQLRRVGKNRRQVQYRARARNVGDAATGEVEICAIVPRSKLRVRGPRCRTIDDIDAGRRAMEAYQFRIRRAARGKVTRVRFMIRGSGIENQRDSARLIVRR